MHTAGQSQSRGVLVSVGSSVSFGLIYFLTPLLAPMSGEAVWAVRTLVSLPFIAVVLISLRRWGLAAEVARRIRGDTHRAASGLGDDPRLAILREL